jgi:Cytochrome c7 and related cytochrome c
MRKPWSLCAVGLLAAACGARPPPPAPAPPPPAGVEHDICEGSPPLPHAPLAGVLRNARCDQDMYYSMSQVADMLGVDCNDCHAPLVEGQAKLDFPKMTHKKEIANWMSTELMQAIKPADGSPMKCSSCHTDEHGKPVAKILGSPRDRVKANEWMSLVMVKKFVAADGSRLKCKSCHAGTPGTPEFRPTVILQSDQLPKHGPPVVGAPAF